jgi:3-hydroxymyristoyl/3-hydroxydecanoyl-(acyl carrier protein) dehydratase
MRYVLIDRITSLKPPEVATGLKCVSLAEDYFADHFPGIPVMPGALQLEGLAQLGGTLLEATLRERGQGHLSALLTMIDRAKFRTPVRPGDRLELECRVLHVNDDGGRVQATGRVEGKVVTEAEITFAFVAVNNERLLKSRREYLNILLTGASE